MTDLGVILCFRYIKLVSWAITKKAQVHNDYYQAKDELQVLDNVYGVQHSAGVDGAPEESFADFWGGCEGSKGEGGGVGGQVEFAETYFRLDKRTYVRIIKTEG